MRREWTRLLEVPLNNREREWLQERLEVLSVEEAAQLAAALSRTDPRTAQGAVDCLLSLSEYQVCHPAGSYEALGRYALRYELSLPAELEEHVDLERLGRRYEDFHPGVFVGGSYVEYPQDPPEAQYDGHTLPQGDLSWSVRLKLASPTVPEGVWVRLPDYSDVSGGPLGELDMALEALGVTLIQDCTLLEAQCVLPEVRDLMDYEDLGELIYDGQDWGWPKAFRHTRPAGLLSAGRRNFSLQSVRIPAKKLLASGPKSLAAGHTAKPQASPGLCPG